MNTHISQLGLKLPSPISCISVGYRSVYVKRDELISETISGNKWRKLKGNLIEFYKNDHQGIVTFGGAFSNHLYATASLGKSLNIPTVGILRGEIDSQNPTIQHLNSCGMILHAVSRKAYRNKIEAETIKEILQNYPSYMVIPEGGNNMAGIVGTQDLVCEIKAQIGAKPIHYVLAAGTGTTSAGIITNMSNQDQCTIIASLKHAGLEEDINSLLAKDSVFKNWCVNHDYHFGGYARTTAELLQFKRNFESQHEIKLDPIYTCKMFFALQDLISQGEIPADHTVVAIHTGGLQGNLGYQYLHAIEI